MNELVRDLEILFALRALNKQTPQKIDDQLFQRHALIWYDGDIDPQSKRYKIFRQKVQQVIEELSTNKGNLAYDWPQKICDIDECHLEEENVTYVEALDTKDIVRHWLNGGTQYGIAHNIHKQMNSKDFKLNMEKAVRANADAIIKRAKKRWDVS